MAWCVVNPTSQRVLLEYVLAGPGAPQQTAVERAIVAECVTRLLGDTQEDRWIETLDAPPQTDTWRCDIDITGTNARRATLTICVPARPLPLEPACAPCLDRVSLACSARIARIRVALRTLATWGAGSVLPLERTPDVAEASLSIANGPLIACRLGDSAGRRAVRMSALLVDS